MHFVPPYMSECPPQSYVQHTSFLSRLFFASICCSINFIASPSLTFIHTMSPTCVCLSLSISLCFLRHYVGIACVQLCSSITFMSYTCFHINSSYQLTCHACQSDCSSTRLSIRFLWIVAHLSVLLSSFTFSTYYHHFNIRLICTAFVSPIQSQHWRLLT